MAETRGKADSGQPAAESADPIARFYNQHPYPPPVADLDDYRDRWARPARRRAEYHLVFPGGRFREDLDVLVAGCGTYQAARHALRWRGGRVLGIDVSTTSVHHTEELRRRYELENLEVLRFPIERIGELDRRFDLIVCTGVLHHLADPDAGLRALRAVLKPGGAMQIMVYAPYGRTGVSMMQEYARLLGIGTSEQEIRDLAETLVEIPRDHPMDPLLREAPDFRRLDALADALLNPRERTYSVPELLDYVERNGLTFGRWYRQAPYLPQCGAVAKTPHARLLGSLPEAEQFAAVELFRGSMTRHSLVIHRNDDPAGTWRFGLDNDAWQDAVPIRIPNTTSVEERLPTGAAAVLINRAHSYSDLILPINASEKRLFEVIDGRHTIAAIAREAGLEVPKHHDALRAFFERLFWHDQVVFDTSRTTGRPATG